MAAIGTGGQGTGIMKWAKGKSGVKFVAVCDLDGSRRKKAAEEVGKDCHEYKDFRELLEKERPDAVTIGTVDHWHALTSIAAMKAGCDVYCEKPLSLTVEEGKAMVAAARKYNRVFQTGSQQRSDSRYRLACELVRNGRIGRVHTVEARIGDNPVGGPFPEVKVPEDLDWDFWKGPTADVPYVKERCHYEFRWWYEYSGGKMTDWGAHHNDIAQWGLGMDGYGPISITATGVEPSRKPNSYNCHPHFVVTYLYPNGAHLVTTSDGENGNRFIGDRGWIFVNRESGPESGRSAMSRSVIGRSRFATWARLPSGSRSRSSGTRAPNGSSALAPTRATPFSLAKCDRRGGWRSNQQLATMRDRAVHAPEVSRSNNVGGSASTVLSGSTRLQQTMPMMATAR
jgi:predicted dehydrogenase